MESEVLRAEMLLAPTMAFKKVQTADKYPKGQSRGRQWKHLRHLLQAADASSLPPDRPNYLNIQSPHPFIHQRDTVTLQVLRIAKLAMCSFFFLGERLLDLVCYMRYILLVNKAPYVDPRTKLRYADPEVFRQIRMLPEEYVQRYLAVRNAAVVLR